MKIIVTGAAGFIGSHLIEKLSANTSNEVFGISRNAGSIEGITWITADLSNPQWTEKLPESADIVIHLAQSKRYREFPDGAADMIHININATAELLEWSRTHGVQKFIFASTGNVYERTEKKLLKETDICVPDSMYSATKLSAEYIVQQYGKFFKTVILRIFGVYGPHQKDMLVPRLIDSVRSGNPITLDSGEGLSLSPLYIDDCVEILHHLLKSDAPEVNRIYNIAGNEILNLRQMVEIIGRIVKAEPNLISTESLPQFFAGDNSLMIRHTGYVPKVNFKKGVENIVIATHN